jgi:hypothetical protein
MSLLDLFQDDFSQISIFSRLSTRARMSILIVDSDSLRKIESNEYSIIDMRGLSIFRHWTHGGSLLVIPSIFGEFGSVLASFKFS